MKQAAPQLYNHNALKVKNNMKNAYSTGNPNFAQVKLIQMISTSLNFSSETYYLNQICYTIFPVCFFKKISVIYTAYSQ